jgi:hypothetical protein
VESSRDWRRSSSSRSAMPRLFWVVAHWSGKRERERRRRRRRELLLRRQGPGERVPRQHELRTRGTRRSLPPTAKLA